MKKRRYFTEDGWLIPERRRRWSQMQHKGAIIGGVFTIVATVIGVCLGHFLRAF